MQRVSADKWYRTRRLADDVTHIDEPHIRTFYRCNIWHVRGRDQDMLVDSGMGVVSLRAHVALVNERPLTAVASHTHFDHIGCHHEFAERCVHHAEAEILAHPTRQATLADSYVNNEIFTALPPEPYRAEAYAVAAAPATRLLGDGDAIDLGDRYFEVIHTPGHSPGGIALYEAATQILFSGDIVYDGPLVEDCYHSDATDYVASMARLYDLPVSVVHGGHFPSYGAERHKEIVGEWLKTKGAL
ncbi:MBL fold metallo-hydrolase [Amorphus sp. 3PC139-8]|uniref:MBL fold metallo-hydrolase n=1 Tax=Amorphus sp. 3PC139-8 TaxID=2735676 RepID=UPI00345C7829